MSTIEENARDFLSNSLSSYRRLAQHLNHSNPRTDEDRWTKDSAYHLCRKNGIRSPRPCGNQPAAITQRNHARQAIAEALTEALRASGTPLASLAPFQTNDVARLSGFPLATVTGNWGRLQCELLALAKLPPKPTVIPVLEEEV
ncbi:hypothetical protein AO254_08320 [Pseudomonas syringae]|nr:hypothetical protein AO254_08320 [Pseudomonas syringae]